MLISESISIKNFPCIISLIGGGGKTTTMYRLAQELGQQGKRVLVTSTTHILLPQFNEVEEFILDSEYGRVVENLKKHFSQHHIVGLATKKVEANKVKGISKEWVERLKKENVADVILVEADGAKGKPFKAPASHEPVLPEKSDLIILVVGIDALGKPITEQHVHRPGNILAILGQGDREKSLLLTPENIRKVIFHPQGLLKGIPENRKTFLLINKVEEGQEDEAVDLAKEILEKGQSRNLKVLIGRAKQRENPILKELGGHER